MLAVNSAVSESTGYSPCSVTQGRELRMPRALFDENAVGTGAGQGTPTENATNLKEVFEIPKGRRDNVDEGAPRYDGPYTVVDNVSPVIAILRHGGTNKDKKAHVSELKCQ
ncbi:hypothetical protein KR074_007663, partial [Drosophila pseudoananassae]